MRRTQLNLDERTYYQLVSYARKQKSSISEAARTLISKRIEEEIKDAGNALLELAKLGEKLKAKGPKDLSINHDYYLYVEPYLTPKERQKRKK